MASLVLAIVFWGASNAGTKYVLGAWPPIFAGATRFLAAGLVLQMALFWASWTRGLPDMPPGARRQLWLRTGLWLAIYIGVFQWAVYLIPVSHVALHLGAAPVWAVLIEHGLKRDRWIIWLYAGALLALGGVVVLLLPSLGKSSSSLVGELLGFACGWIWAWYGRQCRRVGQQLTGAAITAGTMWRAGLLLMVPGLFELRAGPLPIDGTLLWVQTYCVIGGGVLAYWLWNHALRCWSASRVYLFNNLIPVSTAVWAHYTLGEPITPTVWLAMALVITGVVVGQRAWAGVPPSVMPSSDQPDDPRLQART